MSVVMRFGKFDGSLMLPSTMEAPLQTRIRAAVRRCIAEEVERLVDMLDALDGDADMEDEPDREDGGEVEPSLGWTHTMAWGTTDDREEPTSIVADEK